jgi:glycosyltransferase involved in cell wall biosynthesis
MSASAIPVHDSGPIRPLRVLHVITRMIVGGAQENTMLSCALIDRARFPSDLLCGPQTGSEGELHTETRSRGVRLVIEPSLVREVDPRLDMVALWRLYRFLRTNRYDVVHLHSSKAGILGRVAARLAGVPVIVHTAHGWPFTREQSRLGRFLDIALERFCAPLCDTIVVVAEPDRADGLRLRIGRPDQYRLIRSGVEIEHYRDVPVSRAEARRRLGVPDQAFVIGTVGRLSPQKSPLDLLAAFERVAALHPEAHLVLVGDGPQRDAVVARAAEAGLTDRVHLTGLRRDVAEIQRAFDVFALASRWEGLPRVFPQAMAAGLPVVATRVAGAPDAVVPGVTGWLVDVGDIDALAGRLRSLAEDPGLARRMGENGRARVDEFSARRMVDQLSALYLSLAHTRVPGLRN